MLERYPDLSVAVDGPPSPPLVTVRHAWPPDFEPPPDESVLVLMQSWELGGLPRPWLDPMRTLVDELWVPCHYARQCFAASGIDPARIKVIPFGVDVERFTPSAPPATLSTRKRFRFLFVSATVPRKGPDILLDAYLHAFSPDDDVCLLIKDFGGGSGHGGQELRDRLLELSQDAGSPEIHYLDDDIPDEMLPSIYTACHCLVHPYRLEGFGLPILEAMACGLPVVVPAQGPAPDFCDSETGYLVPAAEVVLPESRVGEMETVARPSYWEVDRAALAATLQHIAVNRSEARARGLRSRARTMAYTWAAAAARVHDRLTVLADCRPRRFSLRIETDAPSRDTPASHDGHY